MEQFAFENPKAIFDELFIEIDITVWLGSEIISSVVYTAVNQAGADVTANIVDAVKSTYAGALLKPFIKAGVDASKNTLVCQVTTNNDSKQEYRVIFKVKEA